MALWWRHGPLLRLDRRESPPEAGGRGCALPSTRLGPSMSRWKIPPCSMENSAIFDGTQPRPMEGDCSLFSSHDRTSSNIIEKTKRHTSQTTAASCTRRRSTSSATSRRPASTAARRARARARFLGDRSIDTRIDRSIDTYISIDRCTMHIDRLGTESISRRTDVARARVCREKKKTKARSQPSSPDDGSDGSERELAADV